MSKWTWVWMKCFAGCNAILGMVIVWEWEVLSTEVVMGFFLSSSFITAALLAARGIRFDPASLDEMVVRRLSEAARAYESRDFERCKDALYDVIVLWEAGVGLPSKCPYIASRISWELATEIACIAGIDPMSGNYFGWERFICERYRSR